MGANSDQLRVTGVKRAIMANWRDSEVRELLLQAEDKGNQHFLPIGVKSGDISHTSPPLWLSCNVLQC